MTHPEMDELYELYVLGALETDLASEIDSHVAQQCEHWLAQIHRAVHTTAELSVITDPVTPPAAVRGRRGCTRRYSSDCRGRSDGTGRRPGRIRPGRRR